MLLVVWLDMLVHDLRPQLHHQEVQVEVHVFPSALRSFWSPVVSVFGYSARDRVPLLKSRELPVSPLVRAVQARRRDPLQVNFE